MDDVTEAPVTFAITATVVCMVSVSPRDDGHDRSAFAKKALKVSPGWRVAPAYVVHGLETVAFGERDIANVGALVLRHVEGLGNSSEGLRTVDAA